MRIVYMGTPAFACPALEHLHNSRHEIAGVVTGPDKPAGRGKKLTPTEVAQKATELGYNVFKPLSLKEKELIERLDALNPDLIVVIAFRILPPKLFNLPKYGSVNIHASLLPRYRGAAPINWALINGERETGLTSFFLKKTVDTGDIILQQKVLIGDDENFDSLYDRLADLSGPFVLETVEAIEAGSASLSVQDDSQATGAPKISAFDALIDFGFPAEKVKNFVRGLSTKPGAYTYFRGKKLKVLTCRVADSQGDKDLRPGTVVFAKKNLLVQCADSAIEITSLVPEGKKQMDGISFINGFRPQVGEILGEAPRRDM
ncbi:MAG: methionyl-tRNA formyltransferase [Candidatus Zixiibacteriota bacterium]|nr:MAG: methionyl-tRNA formyltransferase [candidate division Zixibacteria bacterium]